MRSPYSLPCLLLLLLPLGACFPLLDRREPHVTAGGTGVGTRWVHLAEGRSPHDVWGPSRWPRAPQQPQALFVLAKELRASGREHAGFRPGRQEGSEATGFLPAAAADEKAAEAAGPLGSLAEELSGYSRKKGGFSFRFGRR